MWPFTGYDGGLISAVILAMPYGCLDSQKLSEASLKALENALEWWRKSMQISKPETFLVIAGYKESPEMELQLRSEIVERRLSSEETSRHVISITAKDEEDLVQRIVRIHDLLPIESITVFAETRHALGIRPVFKRKFGKALKIKTFRAEFEADHPWISTSSSITWLFWNAILGLWFRIKKRMGRGLRKKMRYLFGP